MLHLDIITLKCLSGYFYLFDLFKTVGELDFLHDIFLSISELILYSVWCYTLNVHHGWTGKNKIICFVTVFCLQLIHSITIRTFTGIIGVFFSFLPDVNVMCGWYSLCWILTVVKSVKHSVQRLIYKKNVTCLLIHFFLSTELWYTLNVVQVHLKGASDSSKTKKRD